MAIKSEQWLGAWQRNLSKRQNKAAKNRNVMQKKSENKEEEMAQRQLSSQIVDLSCKMR